MSSRPLRRRWPLGIRRGSKVLLRSRGTARLNGPISLCNVLGVSRCGCSVIPAGRIALLVAHLPGQLGGQPPFEHRLDEPGEEAAFVGEGDTALRGPVNQLVEPHAIGQQLTQLPARKPGADPPVRSPPQPATVPPALSSPRSSPSHCAPLSARRPQGRSELLHRGSDTPSSPRRRPARCRLHPGSAPPFGVRGPSQAKPHGTATSRCSARVEREDHADTATAGAGGQGPVCSWVSRSRWISYVGPLCIRLPGSQYAVGVTVSPRIYIAINRTGAAWQYPADGCRSAMLFDTWGLS
jgi:hypothetical protein